MAGAAKPRGREDALLYQSVAPRSLTPDRSSPTRRYTGRISRSKWLKVCRNGRPLWSCVGSTPRWRQHQSIGSELDGHGVIVRVNPDIARALKEEEPALLRDLQQSLGKTVTITPDVHLHHEQFDVMAT